jgi:hypothetical protein
VRAAVVQLTLVLVAGRARADVEGIRLSYSAYAGCQDESRFLQGVTARTERIRRAAEGEPSRAFAVAVTREPSTVRGVLLITGLDGTVSRREVTGDSCEEVTSALALITALAVDPLAATAPVPPPAAPGPSSSGAAGDAGPASPLPDASRPPSATIDRVAPTAQPPRSRQEPHAAPSPEAAPARAPSGPAPRTRWAIGGEGQSVAGLVPGWGLGGGAFVDATGPARGDLVPSFRASLFALATRAVLSGTVGAQLEWFVGRMEVCPLRFAWNSDWALSMCAALDVGILRSTGVGLGTNGTEVRPWLATAALGRVAWSPPGAFFVEAGGGLMAPVTRYFFYFQHSGVSEAPLHRIPVAAPTLGLAAGYRLP